ncbi:hypothetical protein KA082_03100 [Candidatus Woesebacteria bacterium]|nr:hypothetical protein [Candidatus Woesebacteria bacterium]
MPTETSPTQPTETQAQIDFKKVMAKAAELLDTPDGRTPEQRAHLPKVDKTSGEASNLGGRTAEELAQLDAEAAKAKAAAAKKK